MQNQGQGGPQLADIFEDLIAPETERNKSCKDVDIS